MKCFTVLLISLFLVGCSAPVQKEYFSPTEMKYSQDLNTDLCFASIRSRNAYGSVVSITNVPCTKKVLSEIKRNLSNPEH